MSGSDEVFTKAELNLLAQIENVIDGRLGRKRAEIALSLDRESTVILLLQSRTTPDRYQACLLELARRFRTKGRLVDHDPTEHTQYPLVIH